MKNVRSTKHDSNVWRHWTPNSIPDSFWNQNIDVWTWITVFSLAVIKNPTAPWDSAHQEVLSWVIKTELNFSLHRHFKQPEYSSLRLKQNRLVTRIKVPISCLVILHICNLWILLRNIVIYLVGRKFYLRRLFCCWSRRKWRHSRNLLIAKTHSYRHTENISLDSESNRYYSMEINRNSQTYGVFVY